MFEHAKALRASGKSFVAIVAEVGIGRATIAKWIQAGSLPDRRRVTLKPSSPLYFQEFFTTYEIAATQAAAPIWSAFFPNGGSWNVLRRADGESRRERTAPSIPRRAAAVAAALCMTPRRLLSHSQAAKVAVLKEASPSFVVMRRLAMRFRGLFRGADSDKLRSWLDDARHSGIHALQQFARILARDIDAVRNAVAEPWSSGQAEGQINRSKTLKGPCSAARASNYCRHECCHSNKPISPESDEDPRKVTKTPIWCNVTQGLRRRRIGEGELDENRVGREQDRPERRQQQTEPAAGRAVTPLRNAWPHLASSLSGPRLATGASGRRRRL